MKNNIYKNFIAIFAIVLAFSACEDEEVGSIFNRTDGGMAAVITDAEGAPVADAKVTLYNFTTRNRIGVKFSNEEGIVDFGRFEAGEYNLLVELTHDNEWFSFTQEAHVISGVNIQHEVNLADHVAEFTIRIRDAFSGELINVDLPIKIGLVPLTASLENVNTNEEIIALVTKSYDAINNLVLTDIPVAQYLVILYSEDKIYSSDQKSLTSFEPNYFDFYINPLSIILESKPLWSLISVDAETPNNNLIPIKSISFDGNEITVTFSNNEVEETSFYYDSNGTFNWHNLYPNNYSLSFSGNSYSIGNDGSLTFNFGYWETYHYDLDERFYSSNVSLTFN